VPLAYAQVRREAAPGNESVTPSYATKVLYPPATSVTAVPNPSHLMRDDEIRNIDEPLAALPEMYAPTWSLESRLYPDTVGMLLSCMLGPPVTTTGNGVITDPDTTAIPTGAFRHVWTAPFGPAGASPQTADLRLAYRDQGVYFQVKGAATDTMAITPPLSPAARASRSPARPCTWRASRTPRWRRPSRP